MNNKKATSWRRRRLVYMLVGASALIQIIYRVLQPNVDISDEMFLAWCGLFIISFGLFLVSLFKIKASDADINGG